MFRENVYGHPILDQPEFLELRGRLRNRGQDRECPLLTGLLPFTCDPPMSALRPEPFGQAISAIAGGFTKGDPRRCSALR